MKLRLRGDRHADLDWELGRVPAVTEMFLLEGNWFRITNVAWGASFNEHGQQNGVDCALVLKAANCPVELVKK